MPANRLASRLCTVHGIVWRCPIPTLGGMDRTSAKRAPTSQSISLPSCAAACAPKRAEAAAEAGHISRLLQSSATFARSTSHFARCGGCCTVTRTAIVVLLKETFRLSGDAGFRRTRALLLNLIPIRSVCGKDDRVLTWGSGRCRNNVLQNGTQHDMYAIIRSDEAKQISCRRAKTPCFLQSWFETGEPVDLLGKQMVCKFFLRTASRLAAAGVDRIGQHSRT